MTRDYSSLETVAKLYYHQRLLLRLLEMKRISIVGLLAFSSIFCLSACAQNHGDIDKLVGDWSGESICVNKEKFPACNDEVVVYHIKTVTDKPNTVHLSADKIVNGKPENMGDFDFIYDAKKQTLFSEFKNDRVHLTLEFDVKGDVLEGGMYSYPDRTQARRMKVTKNK